MMKDMDGWTLLEALRSDESLGPMPVIIVSAKHPQEDPTRTHAHAGQFQAYLVKPFEVNELVTQIAALL
jgi:CheY-like chemotaxis protein